jgi:hypothetical protein
MAGGTRPVILISFIMIFAGIISLINPVSADETVDNYPEGDAWLRIDLISWEGNQSDVWDSDGSPPDPRFRVCVDADGDSIDCFNSPTWENNWTLGAVWNITLDIPDDSFIINLTIECKDNDALNDDECDMNPIAGEWKLYFEFNWTTTTQANFSGDGRLDNDTAWREAASNWSVTISEYGDEDEDGVLDYLDTCLTTTEGAAIDVNGCAASQRDGDSDGVSDADDSCPGTPAGAAVDNDGCIVVGVDSDSDGVDDTDDLFPADANQTTDMDGDGYGDNYYWVEFTIEDPQVSGNYITLRDESGDAFPNDPTQWADRDGDGKGDNPNGFQPDAFPDRVTQYFDTDGDGYGNNVTQGAFQPDDCRTDFGTSWRDVYGCPDLDGDGQRDLNDICPYDKDFWFGSKDQCVITEATGGSDEGLTTTGQQSGSSSEGGTIVGGFLCMALIVGLLFVLVLVKRGISSESSTVVQNRPSQRFQYVQSTPQPQMVTTQHSPPIPPGMNMQSVVNVLEQKQKDAEIEAEKMRQQLASKSASEKQMEKMQSELARLQESMADAENTKIQMQQEMEELRKSSGDSGLQMQDSVIGGDSMVGSTKIESQIINDPEAIARAAIEAYRMAKNEENN